MPFSGIAVHFDWKRRALDVKAALFNADLSEEIYIKQADGYEDPGNCGKIYRL